MGVGGGGGQSAKREMAMERHKFNEAGWIITEGTTATLRENGLGPGPLGSGAKLAKNIRKMLPAIWHVDVNKSKILLSININNFVHLEEKSENVTDTFWVKATDHCDIEKFHYHFLDKPIQKVYYVRIEFPNLLTLSTLSSPYPEQNTWV